MPSRSSKPTACTPRRINITMFTEPFMQRALLAALFLGPLCAFMGVFVTARRMAFFSDTISHAALTGVALGFWFGLADPTWPMVCVSLLVALSIMWLRENTDLVSDTRSEEHTSELQSRFGISYAVFCLK